MTIQPLADHPEYLQELAKCWAAEWSHLYQDWDENRARKEVEEQNAIAGLPLTLVAMGGFELLGSVSLIFDDLPGHEHLNPWLASLYVLPAHRGKFVGSALVKRAEQIFQENGFHEAYLFTETANEFFLKLGWQLEKECFSQGQVITIRKKIWPRE